MRERERERKIDRGREVGMVGTPKRVYIRK